MSDRLASLGISSDSTRRAILYGSDVTVSSGANPPRRGILPKGLSQFVSTIISNRHQGDPTAGTPDADTLVHPVALASSGASNLCAFRSLYIVLNQENFNIMQSPLSDEAIYKFFRRLHESLYEEDTPEGPSLANSIIRYSCIYSMSTDEGQHIDFEVHRSYVLDPIKRQLNWLERKCKFPFAVRLAAGTDESDGGASATGASHLLFTLAAYLYDRDIVELSFNNGSETMNAFVYPRSPVALREGMTEATLRATNKETVTRRTFFKQSARTVEAPVYLLTAHSSIAHTMPIVMQLAGEHRRIDSRPLTDMFATAIKVLHRKFFVHPSGFALSHALLAHPVRTKRAVDDHQRKREDFLAHCRQQCLSKCYWFDSGAASTPPSTGPPPDAVIADTPEEPPSDPSDDQEEHVDPSTLSSPETADPPVPLSNGSQRRGQPRTKAQQRRSRRYNLYHDASIPLATLFGDEAFCQAIDSYRNSEAVLAYMANVHTQYSFREVDYLAYGNILGQSIDLLLETCPSDKPTKRHSTTAERASFFILAMMHPLFLGRSHRKLRPFERIYKFLRSVEDAIDMMQDFLNYREQAAFNSASADSRPAREHTSGSSEDSMENRIFKSLPRLRKLFEDRHFSRCFNVLSRCATPQAPPPNRASAKELLQALHPGRSNPDLWNHVPQPVNFDKSTTTATATPSPADATAPESTAAAATAPQPDENATAPSAAEGTPPATPTTPGSRNAAPQPTVRQRTESGAPSPKLALFLEDDENIVKEFHPIQRGASPGPSGVSADMLEAMFRLEQHSDGARLPGIRNKCCAMIRLLALNLAPGNAYKYLTQSTLLGLGKDAGGIRPIAMAETFSKWTDRVIQAAHTEAIIDTLHPFQFGVLTPAGIETIVLSHVYDLHQNPTNVTLLLDVKNAFNSVSREKILDCVAKVLPDALPYVAQTLVDESYLWLHDSSKPYSLDPKNWYLVSAEGVRQGGSLSPLLFAIVMRAAFQEVWKAACRKGGHLYSLFLDDTSIRAPYKRIRKILAVAGPILKKYGLELNTNKSVIYESKAAFDAIERARADANDNSPRYPHATTLIQDADDNSGYILLGSPVGTAEFVRREVMQRVEDLRGVAQCLILLGSHHGEPRMALTLTRMCFANKLRHLARTVPPDLFAEAAAAFDTLVQDVVLGALGEAEQSLTLKDDHAKEIDDHARALIHRSVIRGGLGIPSTASAAKAGFTAAALVALPLMVKMCRAGLPVPLPLEADLTTIRNTGNAADHPLNRAVFETWHTWRPAVGNLLATPAGDPEATVHSITAPPATADAVDTCDTSITDLPIQTVVRLALENKQPRFLQHILTHLLERWRDEAFEAQLKPGAHVWNQSLLAAGREWRTHHCDQHNKPTPMSRPLLYYMLHSMSGRGHAWVLDTGNRRGRNGLPLPRSVLLYMEKGPLTNSQFRMATRIRLCLPLGSLAEDLRDRAGHTGTVTCYCSKQCRDARAPFDMFGLHLSTIVQGNCSNYTNRHHAVTRYIRELISSAGFRAVLEQTMDRQTQDEEDPDTDTSRSRMDVVTTLPASMVMKCMPDTVLPSSIPYGRPIEDLPPVKVLIDVSFAHPGPVLRLLSTKIPDPVDPVCGFRFNDKLKKYRRLAESDSLTQQRQHANTGSSAVAASTVLIPMIFTNHGRMHSVAQKLVELLVDKASTRSNSGGSDNVSTSRHRWWRDLANITQKHTLIGMLSAVEAARPTHTTTLSGPTGIPTTTTQHAPTPARVPTQPAATSPSPPSLQVAPSLSTAIPSIISAPAQAVTSSPDSPTPHVPTAPGPHVHRSPPVARPCQSHRRVVHSTVSRTPASDVTPTRPTIASNSSTSSTPSDRPPLQRMTTRGMARSTNLVMNAEPLPLAREVAPPLTPSRHPARPPVAQDICLAPIPDDELSSTPGSLTSALDSARGSFHAPDTPAVHQLLDCSHDNFDDGSVPPVLSPVDLPSTNVDMCVASANVRFNVGMSGDDMYAQLDHH